MSGATLAWMAAGVLALSVPRGEATHARLIYNATASEPRGWYGLVRAVNIRVGDVVLADLPADAGRLASQRGYLPVGIPILKRVGAAMGQRVCTQGRYLSIDGHVAARALAADASGRPLTAWPGCRRLQSDELLLLNPTVPASFDSRYFGPVSNDAVRGRAVPLLTW